jgi:hypothetical protein
MVQRGGTVRMNVQNVTLLVCVATLVMVACVLFKTCVNEGFFAPGGPDGGSGNHQEGGIGAPGGGGGACAGCTQHNHCTPDCPSHCAHQTV